MSRGRGLGVHHQNVPATQRRQSKLLIPLFFPPFYFSVLTLCLLPSCKFLRMGCSLGLAPKKSLALQAGRTALPDVAPVLGRRGADAVASLADPAAPAVAPAPSVVAEQAASSVAGAILPTEGLVSPMEAAVTAPTQGQPVVATVVSEGAV